MREQGRVQEPTGDAREYGESEYKTRHAQVWQVMCVGVSVSANQRRCDGACAVHVHAGAGTVGHACTLTCVCRHVFVR